MNDCFRRFIFLTVLLKLLVLPVEATDFNWMDLDGVQGITLYDSLDEYGFASSIALVKSINGDAYDDLIVGSPFADGSRGECFVVFGTPNPDPLVDVRTLDGSNGFRIVGQAYRGDRACSSVAGIGDTNGDGFNDFVVGAENSQTGMGSVTGSAYLVFGRPNFDAVLDLADLEFGDGSRGAVLNGSARGAAAGQSVAGVGDLNDDGLTDFLVGSPKAFYSDEHEERVGAVHLVYGRSQWGPVAELSTLNGSTGTTFFGEQVGSGTGRSLAGGGRDVNRDGTPDFIIGAPDYGAAGAAYIVFGGEPVQERHRLGDLNGVNGYIVYGTRDGERAGHSVTLLDDMNEDGYAEIAVGAPGNFYGLANVRSVQAGGHGVDRSAPPTDALEQSTLYVVFGGEPRVDSFLLTGLNGNNGFEIVGESYSATGASCAAVGDMDGDGSPDLFFGSPRAQVADEYDYHGHGTLFRGGGVRFLARYSHRADSLTKATFVGEGLSGESLGGGGDFNGDGRDDVGVTSPATGNQTTNVAYLLFGVVD